MGEVPARTGKKSTAMRLQNRWNLHRSLASLGDGLLGRVSSQRDEAKRQTFSPAKDLNPGPMPGRPMVNSWTELK